MEQQPPPPPASQEPVQSDWESFKEGFAPWWQRWGNTLLTAVLALALAFMAYQLFNSWQSSRHESAWVELAFESSPQALGEIGADAGDPTVRTLAYLRAGDLLLGEMVTPRPVEEGVAPLDPEASLDDAERLYTQALEAAPSDLYRANALLGLAAVAESRQAWGAAQEHFQQAAEVAGDAHPVLAAQARARLEMLGQIQQPVRVAPDPEPAPAATAQPAPPAEEAFPEAAPPATGDEPPAAAAPQSQPPVEP